MKRLRKSADAGKSAVFDSSLRLNHLVAPQYSNLQACHLVQLVMNKMSGSNVHLCGKIFILLSICKITNGKWEMDTLTTKLTLTP